MKAEVDELLCLLEELASERDDEGSRVAHLCLLLLRSQNDETASRVDDLELAEDRSCVRRDE